ncbi:ribonuclease H family protein [Pelagibacterium sediminicola]|uniref:ribonuclease H family protein n=1 Tax=Pelagibacterium sediminicola TaxID=2248761 RepID=UPI000E31C29C|nr:ribonuclease H [Pelagibacterium sediminicola]
MIDNENEGLHLVLATDGACLGNPGPGGWAVIIQECVGDAVVRRSAIAGCAKDNTTTNNRMELQAAIEALRVAKDLSYTAVTIVTDSQYVAKGALEYLPGWKAKGWRKSDRKPVMNKDLWELLDTLRQDLEVHWEWTRGHSGNPLNEMADMIANDAAAGVYSGDLEDMRRLCPEAFMDDGGPC